MLYPSHMPPVPTKHTPIIAMGTQEEPSLCSPAPHARPAGNSGTSLAAPGGCFGAPCCQLWLPLWPIWGPAARGAERAILQSLGTGVFTTIIRSPPGSLPNASTSDALKIHKIKARRANCVPLNILDRAIKHRHSSRSHFQFSSRKQHFVI